MKGKPWTVEEEKQLREMVQQRKSIVAMAKVFGKSPESVKKKMNRLGLKVVVQQISQTTTTSELPNIEQALRTLNDALEMLKTPGLDQAETLRLRSIINGVKVYKELLVEYLGFCQLEERLFILEAKYAELTKNKAQGT